MADTLFTNATATTPGTVVVAPWLNDVNTAAYSSLTAIAGTADAITATGPLSMTAYAVGQRFVFIPTGTNTTNVVININGLGGRAITKFGNTLTVAGDIVSGMSALIVYDGAGFQLLNPRAGTIANGGTGATTVAGALANLGIVTQPTFRNRLINGDFTMQQRAIASTSTNSTFVADRWQLGTTTATTTYSVFATAGLTPNPFAGRLTATTGTAAGATNVWNLNQSIEGINVADLRWGTASASTITISFWVRASITGTFGVRVTNAAGNRSYVASVTQNVAGTWEYKTVTIPGDTTGTWLATTGIGISVAITAGAGTNFQTTPGAWAAGNFLAPTGATNFMATTGNTFDITGVQLEVGSVATPYEFLPFTTTQLLCQRYFYTSYVYGQPGGSTVHSSNGTWRGVGSDASNITAMYSMFPVPMRAAPTVTIWNPTSGALSGFRNTGSGAAATLSVGVSSSERGIYVLNAAAAITAGNCYEWHLQATADI